MAVVPGRQQGLGARPGRGQVQVGEQHQVLAQPVVLLRHRLLDLEDEVGLAPHLVGASRSSWPRRPRSRRRAATTRCPAPAAPGPGGRGAPARARRRGCRPRGTRDFSPLRERRPSRCVLLATASQSSGTRTGVSLLRVSPRKNGGRMHPVDEHQDDAEDRRPDPGQEHAADLPVRRERHGPVAVAVRVVPVVRRRLDEEAGQDQPAEERQDALRRRRSRPPLSRVACGTTRRTRTRSGRSRRRSAGRGRRWCRSARWC